MRTIGQSEMRIRNGSCQALIDGEWVGVSRVGEDESLTELPSIGDVVEAGTETVKVARGQAMLTLGRDCGDALADEADFLAWVSYVSARIDDVTGLDVTVDVRGARDIQTDAVSPRGGAEEEAITGAIVDLWEAFCADTSAWPVRGPKV